MGIENRRAGFSSLLWASRAWAYVRLRANAPTRDLSVVVEALGYPVQGQRFRREVTIAMYSAATSRSINAPFFSPVLSVIASTRSPVLGGGFYPCVFRISPAGSALRPISLPTFDEPQINPSGYIDYKSR